MALSKTFIEIIVNRINDDIINSHINKVTMLNDTDFLISKSRDCRNKLFVSLNNHEPFITMCEETRTFTSKNSPFSQILKKELENGRILSLTKIPDERIIKIIISNTNDAFKKYQRFVYIELIPNQGNIILTDENNKILTALRNISFDINGRIILRGANYQLPKKSENDSQFSLFERKQIEDNSININELFLNKLFLDGDTYSVIPSTTSQEISLSTLYERYLQIMEVKHRSDINSEVTSTILRHEKSLKKKLHNLEIELSNSAKSELYKEYADLLLTYIDDLVMNPDFTSCTINSCVIPLNPAYSIIENANNYYKKYAKIKRSVNHLKEQIQITEEKIAYFEQLHNQLESSNDSDLKGIEFELMENGYLNKHQLKKQNKNSQGMSQPYYYFYENTKIGFGKNNLQNNYLTFSLAKPQFLFLHVKDKPGSHVIIFSENPSNKIIEKAAMIALINSKLTDGEVQVTKKINVKKLNSLGKVSLSNYKSYYIKKIDDDLIATIKMLKKS